MKKIIAVFLVFVVSVFMYACGSSVSNSITAPKLDTPLWPEEPSVEIVNEMLTFHIDRETLSYVAEIKNTSSFPLEISDLSIDVEKEDGTLLKVLDYISASPRKIASGKSAFVCEQIVSSIDTDINPYEAKIAKLKFNVEKTDIPELDVELVSINLTVRTGFPNIVGKVKNNGTEDITNLFISVPLYSAEGELQTVITAMTDVDACEEASFDNIGIYADYKLDYSNSYLGTVSLYTLH